MKLGLTAALLFGYVSNSGGGVLYSNKKIHNNINLEQVTKKINQKYPEKKLEYFSRGFIHFQDEKYIQDSEIREVIANLNPNKPLSITDPNYAIDAANFNSDYSIMLDKKMRHIGDGVKKWMPVQKPEGKFYEKTFNIENTKEMKNPKLALEALFPYANNDVYINGNKLGILPKQKKGTWSKLLKKHKEDLGFLYKEYDITPYLRQGLNTVRIESEKPKGWFKSHDDLIFRRIQIVHSKEE